jgi:hypothetical protein
METTPLLGNVLTLWIGNNTHELGKHVIIVHLPFTSRENMQNKQPTSRLSYFFFLFFNLFLFLPVSPSTTERVTIVCCRSLCADDGTVMVSKIT